MNVQNINKKGVVFYCMFCMILFQSNNISAQVFFPNTTALSASKSGSNWTLTAFGNTDGRYLFLYR